MLYRKIKDPLTGEESFREIQEQEVRNIIEDAVKAWMDIGNPDICPNCADRTDSLFPENDIVNSAMQKLKTKKP